MPLPIVSLVFLAPCLSLADAAGGGAPPAVAAPLARELAEPDLERLLEKRFEEVRPTAREKAFDRIGWVPGMRRALSLSRESRRPVFLFTMDGRINTGRC